MFRQYLRIVETERSYTPPELEVGDDVFVGRFKNKKATITGFKKDDHNQPVLKTNKGDQKLFKPRIAKLFIDEAHPYPFSPVFGFDE